MFDKRRFYYSTFRAPCLGKGGPEGPPHGLPPGRTVYRKCWCYALGSDHPGRPKG